MRLSARGHLHDEAAPTKWELAHELAHLTLPPRLSLLILWYSLPSRAMAVFLSKGLPAIRKVPILGTLMMVVLGVVVAGMLIAILFLGWPWHEAIFLL